MKKLFVVYLVLLLTITVSGCKHEKKKNDKEIMKQPPTFVISGEVHGDFVASITINLTGSVENSTQTDSQGRFRFENLPQGTYTIRAVHASAQISPANVTVNTTTDTLSGIVIELTAANTNQPGPKPNTPMAFVLTAVSHDTIGLAWNYSGPPIDGFEISRGNGMTSIILTTTNATARSFEDSGGIKPNTNYYYKIRAFKGEQYSDFTLEKVVMSLTAPPPSHTLNIIKQGFGQGVVNGPGLNCGADCSESIEEGTQITLTATPDGHSVFSAWMNCDRVVDKSCIVTVSQARTIVATFSSNRDENLTLSILPFQTVGTYNVIWDTTNRIVTLPWTLQEDSDDSFASPTDYTPTDTFRPIEYIFSGKADGTYCYRAKTDTGGWSNTACITVATPTSPVLKITNHTHYDIIDIRFNNVQKVQYPQAILVGNSADFVFNNQQSLNYALGVGFYNGDGSRNNYFTLSGTVNLQPGQIAEVVFNNPSIGEFLSNFQNSQNWCGEYFDAGTQFHRACFRFNRNGSWTFLDDNVSTGSGSVSLVSWLDYGSVVQFKTCSNCKTIDLLYPFGLFYYQNGPQSWPTIEYVRQ